MPPPRSSGTSLTLVRQINATLQGAVVDVLADLLPEVKQLPRHDALERILDDVGLLERCFQAFRGNPQRFKHLLVDRARAPVANPADKLYCGRSLDEVVAMVVRTAAKRHFRRRLDGRSQPLRGNGQQHRGNDSVMKRLLAILPITKPPPKRPSRGKMLYAAFQDYLQHDWQVPLVPEYATLSPRLVRRLGSRIMEFRAADDIRRLKENPDSLPVPMMTADTTAIAALPLPEAGAAFALSGGMAAMRATGGMAPPPVAEGTAKDERARIEDILTPDGSRLKASAFSLVLLDPNVRADLPDPGAIVRITDMLSAVGGLATKALVGGLGLRTDQLAVLLVTLEATLGKDRFAEVFGLPGRLDAVTKLVQRAQGAGIDQKTPPRVIAALVRNGFHKPTLGPT